jgi:hypothetical protein
MLLPPEVGRFHGIIRLVNALIYPGATMSRLPSGSRVIVALASPVPQRGKWHLRQLCASDFIPSTILSEHRSRLVATFPRGKTMTRRGKPTRYAYPASSDLAPCRNKNKHKHDCTTAPLHEPLPFAASPSPRPRSCPSQVRPFPHMKRVRGGLSWVGLGWIWPKHHGDITQ